jgi:hypothetical protein
MKGTRDGRWELPGVDRDALIVSSGIPTKIHL